MASAAAEAKARLRGVTATKSPFGPAGAPNMQTSFLRAMPFAIASVTFLAHARSSRDVGPTCSFSVHEGDWVIASEACAGAGAGADADAGADAGAGGALPTTTGEGGGFAWVHDAASEAIRTPIDRDPTS